MFWSRSSLGQTMEQACGDREVKLFHSLATDQSLWTRLCHFSIIPIGLQCLTVRQSTNCQSIDYFRGKRRSGLERILLHRSDLLSDFDQHFTQLPMFLQAIHCWIESQNSFDFRHLPKISQTVSQWKKWNDSWRNDEFDVD